MLYYVSTRKEKVKTIVCAVDNKGVLGVAPGSIGTLLARAERAFLGTYEPMEPAEREDSLDTRIS